jgi:hypothetical protein
VKHMGRVVFAQMYDEQCRILLLLLDFFRGTSFWDTKNLVVCLRAFVHLELLSCVVLGEVVLVKKGTESVTRDVMLARSVDERDLTLVEIGEVVLCCIDKQKGLK